MAVRSRDPTIGCFAASNLYGRPSRQVSTKRSLAAHLPSAVELLSRDYAAAPMTFIDG